MVRLFSAFWLVALAGCGASSHLPGGDDDLGDWSDGDADSDPGGEGEGEGEVESGPREPDGICTDAENSFDDPDGWIWGLDSGDFVEDCNLCASGCVGDIATFRSESDFDRDEPFGARVMVSNCGASEIAQPVHVQLFRREEDGEEVVLVDGWTPVGMPPWAAVWVDIEVNYERCRRSAPEKHWRLDADSVVPECDEQNNEPDMSAPGC